MTEQKAGRSLARIAIHDKRKIDRIHARYEHLGWSLLANAVLNHLFLVMIARLWLRLRRSRRETNAAAAAWQGKSINKFLVVIDR